MLRKLEYINFKLCSIKYENFVFKKFYISRLLLILYVSLKDLSALHDQVCEVNTIESSSLEIQVVAKNDLKKLFLNKI